MESSAKIIIVAGANGNLGKLVCEALTSRAKAEGQSVIIRGLVRKGHSENREVSEASEQITLIPVDYENEKELAQSCAGAYSVISTLQGLGKIIIDVQSYLLRAAIAANVRRFIPSDFSADFTKLKEGTHRNFDLRRRFHKVADDMIKSKNSKIEFSSIFQGGFTELLGSGWVLFDYNKHLVTYFGSPDNKMEFTTWKNTAEFAAAVAIDANSTPRFLYIAGQRITPNEAQRIARAVTNKEFALKSPIPVWMLRFLISMLKTFKPGKKDDVMPIWVALQYAYCGALGVMSPERLDNDRYKGIQWIGINDVVKAAFMEAEKNKQK